MRNIKSSFLSLFLTITLLSQLFSCGYVLHPERRGQKSGQVDWAIVGLDSIGIIFFIIPGLIAFGVDIYSGTLYLQNSASPRGSLEWNKVTAIKLDPKNINEKTIATAIKENSGVEINFADPRLKIYRDKELEMKLAKN